MEIPFSFMNSTNLNLILMSHSESKDVPTQMTKQSFTNVCFISSDRLYTLKSFTEMFTMIRLNFPYTWLQFIKPRIET